MHEGFLQAIREAPDDDTPRLVYADWLDEQGQTERAEFIRAQVHMLQAAPTSRRYAALRRRARQLLAEHGRVWIEELPKWARRRCEFHRGFVHHVACTALQFIRQGEQLLRAAPVQSLRLRRTEGRIGKLAEASPLRSITALNLYGTGLTGADVETLAGSLYLHRLTSLRLGFSNIGPEGARALAASPNLTGLTCLNLTACFLYAADFAALATAPWLPRLTTLQLKSNYGRAEGLRALLDAPRLPRLTVLSLGSNSLLDTGAEMLARSPVVEELTRLDLSSNGISAAGVRALAASPGLARLTRLDLVGNRIGDAGARALIASPYLSNLRKLDVRYCYIHAEEDALRRRFGKRLKIRA
jgi:uncharacterized protein (TIGR02996 family)